PGSADAAARVAAELASAAGVAPALAAHHVRHALDDRIAGLGDAHDRRHLAVRSRAAAHGGAGIFHGLVRHARRLRGARRADALHGPQLAVLAARAHRAATGRSPDALGSAPEVVTIGAGRAQRGRARRAAVRHALRPIGRLFAGGAFEAQHGRARRAAVRHAL